MNKIIIVSIRVSQSDQPSTGGLAVAVEGLLQQNEELSGIWVGWNGTQQVNSTQLHVEQRDTYTAMTFSLTPEQYLSFYCGSANNCLWPAFHYRSDLMRFHSHEYQQYLAVNEQIATYIKQIAHEDDLIWVHDYHLIPLAHYCRQQGLQQRIGFFLHTPFPCPEVVQTIPRHTHWLPLLLDYDVVGVQSEPDCVALQHSLKRFAAAGAPTPYQQQRPRQTTIKSYPISIDPELIHDLSQAPIALEDYTEVPLTAHHKTIISADRLDYTKGLIKRFQSFETLLAHYPTLQGHLNYVQVAPSTREGIACYKEQQNHLETLAGQINGHYASVSWSPLVYINRAFEPKHLMHLFRASQVGYVAPLRDGMNLVAKEYVAAQDPTDPGVLVLSQFTGAASELGDSALLINPYDNEATAHCLFKALHMPLAERQERHQQLWSHLQQFDLMHWCSSFIKDLNALPTLRTASLA